MSPPDWAGDTIENWATAFPRQPTDLMELVTCIAVEKNSQVDFREVVGQNHHFAGQTWWQAATFSNNWNFKMRTALRLFEDNPLYFFSGEIADTMQMVSLNGGPWFCHPHGFNRSVVGKFACERVSIDLGYYPMVSGVTKFHYFADTTSWGLLEEIRKFQSCGVQVAIERSPVGVRRIPIGQASDFKVVFNVTDRRHKSQTKLLQLNALEFREFAKSLIKLNGRPTLTQRLRSHHPNGLLARKAAARLNFKSNFETSMPSTNTLPTSKTKTGISTLILTREVRGHVLTAKVTPGSWTRPHLPFQILVEMDGKKGGHATVRDAKLTYSQAFMKDLERLFAQVRLADCVKCGEITFDPATVSNYKSQCCHACFMAEIRLALTKENEQIQMRVARMDMQHKAKGYTHRVTAWVHPENGSDVNIDFWTKQEPTQAEVARTLKEQGSVVLDDYIIVALT